MNISPAQEKVLTLLLQGKTPKQISRHISRAEPTVKAHLRELRKLYGARSSIELVVLASGKCDQKQTLIPSSDQRDLLIYAFRYSLGRATYAPHTVIDVLQRAWSDISAGDKDLYLREIQFAVENDLAGAEIDKRAWQKFLNWAKEVAQNESSRYAVD